MTDTRPAMAAAERLEAMVDDLAARLTALPEETFTHRPSAEEWTAAEVVGHMTEMMPYWASAATAVAAEPGRPFGRALDDPDRVGAVRAANDLSRAEALARLRHAAHEAANAIRPLDGVGWEARGMHHARGAMTAGQVLEELLVGHAAAHVRQALTAAGAGQVGS
jgi:uncharacterized damage-inducible protein DinB